MRCFLKNKSPAQGEVKAEDVIRKHRCDLPIPQSVKT